MNTTRSLTPGQLILLLGLILIAITVILLQYMGVFHAIAASMVEYAKNAGHMLAATAIEY